MKAHNHYEAAFEHFLRSRQIAYVAVDEAKKAIFRDARLKSFDFIVYTERGNNWLTDIKGRRWKARPGGGRPAWENWVTQDDLDGLLQWQEVFGVGFRGIFVFAYGVTPGDGAPAELVHVFRDEHYIFAGVPVEQYREHARVRSPKWGTINMPVREFAALVRPIADWL